MPFTGPTISSAASRSVSAFRNGSRPSRGSSAKPSSPPQSTSTPPTRLAGHRGPRRRGRGRLAGCAGGRAGRHRRSACHETTRPIRSPSKTTRASSRLSLSKLRLRASMPSLRSSEPSALLTSLWGELRGRHSRAQSAVAGRSGCRLGRGGCARGKLSMGMPRPAGCAEQATSPGRPHTASPA